MSHITGGGLAANLERVLPVELTATLDRTTWSLPPVFRLVAETGGVAREDLEQTLNCGVGMVSLTAAEDADRAVAVLAGFGIDAWVAGTVTEATAGDGGRVSPARRPPLGSSAAPGIRRRDPGVSLGGPRCGNHHRPVRVAPRTVNSDRQPSAAPANVRRGHPWGAAVQRRSRPRLLAI